MLCFEDFGVRYRLRYRGRYDGVFLCFFRKIRGCYRGKSGTYVVKSSENVNVVPFYSEQFLAKSCTDFGGSCTFFAETCPKRGRVEKS